MASGIGFTIKLITGELEEHPFNEAVAVILANKVVEELLVVMNGAMFPFPLPAKPMEILSFTHESDVPGRLLDNITAVLRTPVHKVWSFKAITAGTGFTVMGLDTVSLHPLVLVAIAVIL